MASKSAKKSTRKTKTKKIAKPRARARTDAQFTTTFSITPGQFENADEVYTQLRICLSRITHFPINDIRSNDSLEAKFHFNAGGLRVLAQNLEACFAQAGYRFKKPLDRDAIQAAKTVGDLADILNKSFGY